MCGAVATDNKLCVKKMKYKKKNIKVLCFILLFLITFLSFKFVLILHCWKKALLVPQDGLLAGLKLA